MELFSAYCVKGRWLLQEDIYKQIVADSLQFMVQDGRIWLYGLVILPNEFHLLWQKQPAWKQRNVRQMLLKFTAQQIKYRMRAANRPELETYRSQLRDRQFQFWERGASALPVTSAAGAWENLQNMHDAPVTAGLCRQAEAYRYSSADFYMQTGAFTSQQQAAPIPSAPLLTPGRVHTETGQPPDIQPTSGESAPDGSDLFEMLTHYAQHFPP